MQHMPVQGKALAWHTFCPSMVASVQHTCCREQFQAMDVLHRLCKLLRNACTVVSATIPWTHPLAMCKRCTHQLLVGCVVTVHMW
jgi:hypothetical protein